MPGKFWQDKSLSNLVSSSNFTLLTRAAQFHTKWGQLHIDPIIDKSS